MTPKNLNFREFVDYQQEDWEVLRLYQSGMKIREISKKTGLSLPEIYRALKREGGYPNRVNLRHDMVKMYAGYGLPTSRISDLTNYTIRNVRYIKRGLK